MTTESFPLISKRAARQKRVQTVQHFFGAGMLIFAASDHLRAGSHSVLPYLEIAAGAVLIISVILERVRHHASRGGVAWVELAGATMMLVEAFAKLEERHHLSFYILSFFAPIVLFAFAIFDARIAALRAMQANEDGFQMRVRAFWRRRVAWRDVGSWRRTADAIEVALRNGSTKRLSFRDAVNASEALEWASAQFARRASAAEQLPRSERGSDEREKEEVLVPDEDRRC
ncbi:MAG TPA: hypothetical protein VF980_03590 [Thermoanaerobaculia bacterium]